MRRRPQSQGEPVKATVSPDTLKLPGVAAPNSAVTCVAAVPALFTDPAKPAAGEQVIRPLHGNAGWPNVAAVAL